METMIRRCVLMGLIWVCTICLCPTKRRLDLCGLKSGKDQVHVLLLFFSKIKPWYGTIRDHWPIQSTANKIHLNTDTYLTWNQRKAAYSAFFSEMIVELERTQPKAPRRRYIHITIIVTWSGVLYHVEWMRSLISKANKSNLLIILFMGDRQIVNKEVPIFKKLISKSKY